MTEGKLVQIKWAESKLQVNGLFKLNDKTITCSIGSITNNGKTVYQAFLLDEDLKLIGEPTGTIQEAKDTVVNWANSQNQTTHNGF